MRDALGPDTVLGYCTNVHAGRDVDELLANLWQHTVAVKRRVSPDEPMGVGLWLSPTAADDALRNNRLPEVREFLDDHGLLAYTLNGFPQIDFHRDTVKHRVYRPDWADPRRLEYILALVKILAALLPEDAEEGSISTLPLGYRGRFAEAKTPAAAAQLTDLVHHLARAELDTGKLIHVDLEPEPGCVMDTADDVVRFFEDHLLGTPDDPSVRAYLRVCHDVCHSAVMFEDQAEALGKYRDAGIKVGKVQVSSAVAVNFDEMDEDRRRTASEQLAGFDERRYLHQTCVRRDRDEDASFYDDLPDALASPHDGDWRVHFHVPIYLDRFGELATTRDAIDQCLAAIRPSDGAHHFEAETYAWNVLPESLQTDTLAEGIARELLWLKGDPSCKT